MEFTCKGFQVGKCEGEKVVDGETMPLVLLPPQPNKSDLESLLVALKNHKDWFEQMIVKNSAVLLRGFDVKDAVNFNDIVEAFGWDNKGYVGPALRTHIYKRIRTANEGPLSEFIYYHHEMVLLPKGDTWSIHKFGGTCARSSQRIQNVAEIIIKDDSERKLVVVSAMSKVTDMMYDLIYKAQSRDDSYLAALDAVLEKHKLTTLDLLDGDDLASFLSRLHHDINNLKAMLRAIYIAGHAT
ncbi:unnamed protein product [Ilex paraguariensis]|uniref:Aspartate/glutamate/uridylate kinase domain-containing protein n=1 Tax=Ilex paraguariensis TaxID=185542 RepID=A0ABC8RGY9_9AQUA